LKETEKREERESDDERERLKEKSEKVEVGQVFIIHRR
jgi:hypothetical protein